MGLIEPETRTTAGRAVAIIDVSDEMRDYQIPLGATAQVAIYTEHWHHLSLLRKVLLRMRSWQNYVFLEGRLTRLWPFWRVNWERGAAKRTMQ